MANPNSNALTRAERTTVGRALAIIRRRLDRQAPVLTSSSLVRDFLRLKLGTERVEIFLAIWLDGQNRVIAAQELARGTITKTTVYPREVARRALELDAVSVIFAHNHPSGAAEQSLMDELLTKALKRALELVDCHVLDHFVVGGLEMTSFAEKGLLDEAEAPARKRQKAKGRA